MRLKLIGTVGLIILIVALTATAVSAATNTVATGSSATVTNRILVAVPVTVVCDPLPNTPLETEVQVTLEQASGSSISTGTGFSGGPLTCDGVTQNALVVGVTPDSGSGPFHGGGAVARAFFFYNTGTSCGPGCVFITNSESGSSGPTAISLRG